MRLSRVPRRKTLSNAPKVLFRSERHNFSVLSYIAGQKIISPDLEQVQKAADFIVKVNSHRQDASARNLGFAKDACRSLHDHVQLTKDRLDQLLMLRGELEDQTFRSMQSFVGEALYPHLKKCTKQYFPKRQNLKALRFFRRTCVYYHPLILGFTIFFSMAKI